MSSSKSFPDWLKKRIPAQYDTQTLQQLKALRLNTVCQSARCPNLAECYGRNTATFMILGDICTRGCRYCAIATGRPAAPDADEPARVAEASRLMNLRHVVITSVNRDDLPDDGAGHWAETVRALREALPESLVEVLTPDFRGKMACVETVLDAGPHVFNHNIEMAPGLFRALRPGGDYRRSLDVLAHAADYAPRIATKSGLMVGFGESLAEVRAVLEDLREHGVSILTIGQYIQPSPAHAPVVEFVRPEQFEDYRTFAEELGFAAVASGPFVRSSYQAEQTYAARRV